MRLVSRAYRTVNRTLEAFGLSIVPVGRDYDDRPLNDEVIQSFCERLASEISTWLSAQTLFDTNRLISAQEVREFYEAYLASPYRQRGGGSRFNNLLCLFVLSRSANPDLIIDSGTFKGASAWALHLGCPDAEVLSFDIDMTNLLQREQGVRYIAQDWFSERPDYSARRTLAYFDDHVDQAKRLIEAQEAGVQIAVFDDDFPASSFAPMAHGGFSLPKVEFVLDDSLRQIPAIRWRHKGRSFQWDVDVPYLDRARKAISKTERMPNTSLITGIHQTPYRVVRIARD